MLYVILFHAFIYFWLWTLSSISVLRVWQMWRSFIYFKKKRAFKSKSELPVEGWIKYFDLTRNTKTSSVWKRLSPTSLPLVVSCYRVYIVCTLYIFYFRLTSQAKSCWRSYWTDWSHKRRRSSLKNRQASSRNEHHTADLQPTNPLWEISFKPARPLPCIHRLQEGFRQGLTCSFVGNHEELQHQHQPYPSHQKPLWQAH